MDFNKGEMRFARGTEKESEQIKNLTDEQLFKDWKNLAWVVYILQSSSTSDLQTLDVMEKELISRGTDKKTLENWIEQEQKSFKENPGPFTEE
jgi:hypothetical protein